jgi:hypothetical protein
MNTERKIYPDYDLEYNDKSMGIQTYVRKQNKVGIWYLIKVWIQYDLSDNNDLLWAIKEFHNRCYRTLLFFRLPEEGDEVIQVRGFPIGGEKDPVQISEEDRLIIKPIK